VNALGLPDEHELQPSQTLIIPTGIREFDLKLSCFGPDGLLVLLNSCFTEQSNWHKAVLGDERGCTASCNFKEWETGPAAREKAPGKLSLPYATTASERSFDFCCAC
jgi:hypothetical protein